MLIKIKTKFPEIVLGALLAVAIFGMGMLFASQNPQKNQQQQHAAEPAKHIGAPSSAEERIADYTQALAWLTAVLAVSTIGIGVITGIGIRNQTRDTQILQRAYIAVDGGGVSPLISASASIAHIKVRNVGNLPARNLQWFISAEDSVDGVRINFPIDENKFYGDHVLPPGTDMVRSQNFVILPNVSEQVQTGQRWIYVWGEVSYLDGFGIKRFTRFCHRYGRHGYRATGKTGGQVGVLVELTAESMRYHRYGNDAD